MRQCKSIFRNPASVNRIELATAKKIVPKNLYLFLPWMVTNDDIEVEFESSCSHDADERKIICMAQDAVYCLLRSSSDVGNLSTMSSGLMDTPTTACF